MKSRLSPVCNAILENKSNPITANSIISQYVTSNNINYQTTVDLLYDDKFSSFLEILMTTLTSNPIPKPESGPIPNIVPDILIYLNKLMVINPVICDRISTETNLDLLIPQFFSQNIEKNEIADQNASYIFQPLKFIALVASSKSVMLTTTNAANLLIIVIFSLLTNAQLAAWAAAIIAGLLRNSPTFNSILKVHPMFKCVKDKLTALLPSSDPCVVVSALSATVPLFALGDDSNTAIKAAFKYIIEDSVFPLTTKLCCWVIGDLVNNVMLNEDSFNGLLQIPLHSSGVRAYCVICLLIDLIDMKYKFGSLSYNTEFFEQMIVYPENYVASIGCQYLNSVYENYPEYIVGIDEDGSLLKQVLMRYLEYSTFSDPERIEAFLVQIRLLIINNQIPQQIISSLVEREEALFMDFMRHIENGDSFISVSFFNFLLICSKSIEGWGNRIKRILVDSQFPALLVHVLTNSKNRRAITDALRALQYFMNNCQISQNANVEENGYCLKDSYFFSNAVSGFLLMNQKNESDIKQLHMQTQQQINEYKLAMYQVNNDNAELHSEIERLKKSLEEEKLYNSQSNSSMIKLKDQLNERDQHFNKLKNKYQELKSKRDDDMKQIHDMEEKVRIVQADNADLKKQCKKLEKVKIDFQRATAENGRLNENIKDLEAKIAYSQNLYAKSQSLIETLRAEIRIKEEEITKLQQRCQKSQELNQTFQQASESNRQEIQQLNETITKLTTEISKEKNKLGDMAKTISDIQEENLRLKSSLSNEAVIREKYSQKKKLYLQKIKEIEREKRRWESIAKFNHHVCNVKKAAVQDVFGEVNPDTLIQ